VIGQGRHLPEDRLIDCYYAQRHGERLHPPAAEHLVDCDECAKRFAELTRLLDGVRRNADADTDRVFTPERLHEQHRHIARRLVQVGHAARVINFPGRLVSRSIRNPASRAASRWIAAAAAAGLFVGLGVGVLYDSERRANQVAQLLTASARSARPAGQPLTPRFSSPTTSAAEDAFLSDLALAVERPHTRELRAFDALTPHVREVANVR
jgi:hypothetical protein